MRWVAESIKLAGHVVVELAGGLLEGVPTPTTISASRSFRCLVVSVQFVNCSYSLIYANIGDF